MLLRTHFTITLFAVLILLSSVEHKISFVLMSFAATLIPDLDTPFSKVGNHLILRPFQFFVKHRGLIHSFTFLSLLTLFFVLFFPILALGFFLGYGLHLFADSFSVEGIQVLYPFKKKIFWRIRTGGKTEMSIFVVFLLANLFLILLEFSGFF
ncbi:MAG: metal-dependent hydrolase [Candidatus Pacearchaeota archaeon]